MTDNDTLTSESGSHGKSGVGDIGQKIFVGVVTAIVLGGLTLLWNFASQGGLVRILGGVTKDEAVTKDELKTAVSSLGPRSSNVSFTAVRFGANGSSKNGQDPGEPFTVTPGLQRFGASVNEFPICEVTEIRVRAAEGRCLLVQNAGEWAVVVEKTFACGITCFKPAPPP